MPLYVFQNEDNGEVFEERFTLSEREQYLKDHPNIKQLPACPRIGDSVRLGVRKADDTFTDVLRKIKAENRGSTIETR